MRDSTSAFALRMKLRSKRNNPDTTHKICMSNVSSNLPFVHTTQTINKNTTKLPNSQSLCDTFCCLNVSLPSSNPFLDSRVYSGGNLLLNFNCNHSVCEWKRHNVFFQRLSLFLFCSRPFWRDFSVRLLLASTSVANIALPLMWSCWESGQVFVEIDEADPGLVFSKIIDISFEVILLEIACTSTLLTCSLGGCLAILVCVSGRNASDMAVHWENVSTPLGKSCMSFRWRRSSARFTPWTEEILCRGRADALVAACQPSRELPYVWGSVVPNGVIRFSHPPSKCWWMSWLSHGNQLQKLCRLCEIHHVKRFRVRWETSSGHHRKRSPLVWLTVNQLVFTVSGMMVNVMFCCQWFMCAAFHSKSDDHGAWCTKRTLIRPSGEKVAFTNTKESSSLTVTFSIESQRKRKHGVWRCRVAAECNNHSCNSRNVCVLFSVACDILSALRIAQTWWFLSAFCCTFVSRAEQHMYVSWWRSTFVVVSFGDSSCWVSRKPWMQRKHRTCSNDCRSWNRPRRNIWIASRRRGEAQTRITQLDQALQQGGGLGPSVGQLVDIRALGRPDKWDSEMAWRNWSFVMKAYGGIIDQALSADMTIAERSIDVTSNDTMSGERKRQGLCSCCSSWSCCAQEEFWIELQMHHTVGAWRRGECSFKRSLQRKNARLVVMVFEVLAFLLDTKDLVNRLDTMERNIKDSRELREHLNSEIREDYHRDSSGSWRTDENESHHEFEQVGSIPRHQKGRRNGCGCFHERVQGCSQGSGKKQDSEVVEFPIVEGSKGTTVNSRKVPRKAKAKGRVTMKSSKKGLWCKAYFTANQLAKKCRKREYESIYDRFIRDKAFRKAMIEVGRSEQMIMEMDKLRKNHSYKASKEVIEFYRGNWWIHSNVARVDSVPTRYEPEFKSVLSTMQRLKRAEDKKKQEAMAQTFFILVFMALAVQLVGVWSQALTSKMVWPLMTRGNLYSEWFITYWVQSFDVQKNLDFFSLFGCHEIGNSWR